MSERIILLPEEVRTKIRAGEVVERPVSVVKELTENSIDAGSSRIICEVERGGLERIKVIDNGEGMNPRELELSLERYATSKIKTIDDITHIRTFGFRGEALPSIRAVSELFIESKPESAETGFSLRAIGEEIIEKRPCPRKSGTTVDVKRLFFNIPVRRKFLKSESVEFRHIKRLFIALALVNRNIHFTLFNNGSLNLDIPPSNDLNTRLVHIIGFQTVQNLLSLSNKGEGIDVEGIISKPEESTSRRDFQYIFVNRRWINSNLIRQAIYKAYGNSLWGKHPSFAIEIYIPGTELDINVHPMKKEVKFNNEREIFKFIYNSIKDELISKKGLPEIEENRAFVFKETEKEYFAGEEQELFQEDKGEKLIYREEKTIPKGFWQLHNSYIFASTKTGFMILDQHAAHERILYDQIIRREGSMPPQLLLFPLRLELTIQEEEFLEGNIENFYELGFRIKKFSGRTIIIEGIPSFMKKIDEDVVHDLFHKMTENVSGKEVFNTMAKEVACKSAIKAGEDLKQEEINRLFDNLFATDDPYTCPHGRPTMIKFSIAELERRFKRR